jgi:hypothetical protein
LEDDVRRLRALAIVTFVVAGACGASHTVGGPTPVAPGVAFSCALRIKTAAIAADNFDLRVLTEPFGCSGGCTILQHIDNLAPLQVDNNGPVCATLSPAPVVDACHPYSCLRTETGDLALQMP